MLFILLKIVSFWVVFVKLCKKKKKWGGIEHFKGNLFKIEKKRMNFNKNKTFDRNFIKNLLK